MSSQDLGLNYPIRVPDEFSAQFNKLLGFIKETRTEFAALRDEMKRLGVRPTSELSAEALARKQAAQSAKDQAKAARDAANATARAATDAAKAAKDQARQALLSAQATATQAKAASTAAAAQAAQTKAAAQLAATTAQTTAAQARAAAAASRAALAQQAAAKAATALSNAQAAVGAGVKQTTSATVAAEDATSRWLFTFRRLVGIFAVFQGVRLVIGGVRDTIKEAILFNASVEDITLGIASLLVSVGQVRNAFGEAVPPAQQLALANVEATRQVKLLRVEALKTSATFKGLAETFQIAVGPGLAAGLNLEEIRKLTVRVSQSAAALGLPQNQLPEEIRSLLSGTIQQRTTRIASALGISNEDIRLAKEAGTLADFLEKKFSAFALAAEQSTGNFTVLVSNLVDGFQQLIGQGSLKFFNELKDLFKDLQGVLVEVNATGVDINPRAAAITAAVADGLTTAAQQARELVQQLGADNLLRVATALGNIIGAVSRLIKFTVEVFTEFAGGVSFVVNIFSDLVNMIRPIAGLMSGVAAFALKWYLTTKLLTVSFGAIAKILSIIAPVMAEIALAASSGSLIGFFASLNSSVISNFSSLSVIIGTLALAGTLLATTFGRAGDEAERAANAVKTMRDIVNEVPSIVTSANQPLRDNGDLLKKLTEDLNKALDNLKATISTIGVKGATAEDIKALLSIDNQLRDQGKELLGELNNKQKERVDLLKREEEVQKRINSLSPIGQQIVKETLPLFREAIKLRDRAAVLEQEIKTAIGSQQQELLKQLSEIQNRREALETKINVALPTGREGEIKTLTEALELRRDVKTALLDTVTVQGAIVAADNRIADLTEQRRRLVAEIADIEANRVLASGLQEEETQRKRILQESALLAAQRSRLAFQRAEEAAGFRIGDASRSLAAAQTEQIIAKQKLVELAQEQRFEESGIRRSIDLLRLREADLKITQEGATLEEDKAKAATALATAVAARESLERKLSATQIANADQLQTERLRVNAILLDALNTIRKTSTIETEAAQRKTAAAKASFDAETARLAIADAEQSRGFRLAETEKQILELQADLGPARARLELTRQEQQIGEREAQNEVESLKTLRNRLSIQAALGIGTAEGIQAAQSLTEVSKTLLAAESRLAALRAQNSAELRDATAKDVVAQQGVLTQIARQAAQERLNADQRFRAASAVLEVEKRRSAILKIDAETGFRLSDSAKKLLEIETDTTAARTRLDITRETQRIQEQGIAGTIEASARLEDSLRAELKTTTDTEKRATLERLINSTLSTRIQLESSLGAIRSANLTELSGDLRKLRDNNLELLNSISSDAVRESRSLALEAQKTTADTTAERARIAAIGDRLLIETSNERLRIEEKIKIAEADLGPINAQIAAQKTLNDEKVKSLELTLNTLRSQVTKDKAALPGASFDEAPNLTAKIAAEEKTITDLENELLRLREANNAQIDSQTQKLEEAKRKLAEMKAIADQPFALGAKQGFKNFTDDALNNFQNMTKLVEDTLNNLANTITDALVAAFDPNSDATIKERFQQFFADLAKEIGAMIIKLQIAKALVSIGFADGGKVPSRTDLAVGRAAGGYVPHRGMASLGHVRAKGFARGGRPAGLDPRDTVPIWAQPGEWVMRLDAVRKYGEGAMAAINQGLVDPSALRSATDGARATVAASSVSRVGFATGGAVGSSGGGGGSQLGVIVATEEQYGRLLKGGKRAQLEFMSENRDAIRAALRV